MFQSMHHELELLASALNFVGGGALSLDALSPLTKAYLKKGRERWEKYREKHGQSRVVKPSNLASASRAQWVARFGFLVMTSGFVLDFLLKW